MKNIFMKSKNNFLIVKSASFKKSWENEIRSISKKDIFLFIKDEKSEIIKNVKKAHVLIGCPRYIFQEENFKLFSHLKWIHAGGAGIENYISQKFSNSKIIFTNGRVIQGPEVADHALGLILSFTRNLYQISKNINNSKINHPIEIKGKNVLIIGMGGIGICIAERLKSFGANIDCVTNDTFPLVSFINKIYFSNCINKIAKSYDIIICAAPLTNKTIYLLDYNFFKKMKKGSIFINVSRGKIVKTDDLIKNSVYKKFRGIGLDVTDPEPLERNSLLRKLDNVFITPHVAGPSDNNRKRGFDLIKENIRRFISNDSLLNVVDKKKEY
jgi:phosphoglycerate dehydrogenase-like enzyme